MKTKILAGLVTATLFGGTAMAGEHKKVEKEVKQEAVQPAQTEEGSGGSSVVESQDQITNDAINLNHEQGTGGAGMSEEPTAPVAPPPAQLAPPPPPPPKADNMAAPGGVSLNCPQSNQATGGAGLQPVAPPPPGDQSSLARDFDGRDAAIGGSGYAGPAYTDVKESDEVLIKDRGVKHHKEADMRGLTVLLGAGVEGYTGGLASEVRPGAAVGVTAALKPTKVFGVELAYSGAANNLRADAGGSGPDIIRNGGQAALTFGLSATPVQPYVMGGFGLNHYNVRNGETLGFRDDTNANVPVGAGLRTHIGDFTADARLNYNFLLNNDFAAGTGVTNDTWTGRYTGTVNIGGTF